MFIVNSKLILAVAPLANSFVLIQGVPELVPITIPKFMCCFALILVIRYLL